MPRTLTAQLTISTDQPLSSAEWELYFWRIGTAGSFITALFNVAARADLNNLARLSLGFPDEIAVYRRYADLPGYWEALQRRATPALTPADDLGELNEGE